MTECQDRDCKREAEGPPVLTRIGDYLVFELTVCRIHRRQLEVALGPHGDHLVDLDGDRSWRRLEASDRYGTWGYPTE